MQTQRLGKSDLNVTRIAYGCMPLGGQWDSSLLTEEIRQAAYRSLGAALDAGINFFDHADIYTRGKSETVFGEWLKQRSGLRPRIFVQSKCGICFRGDPTPVDVVRYNFSYDHIVKSVEGSLARLGTDYLDVLLLHRPDVLVEPQEVARAFDDLQSTGKVRHFGVSNHSAAQIELLRRHVRQELVTNQVELHLLHAAMFDGGVNWNLPAMAKDTCGDATLEYCRRCDITLQAWAPLARGVLTGAPHKADHPKAEQIIKTAAIVAELATAKGVSGEAIVIAWLLRHPAGIQPVIGTRQSGRIAASCQAQNVTLTRDEWYRLYAAGRGRDLP